jgi:hypothetical protein
MAETLTSAQQRVRVANMKLTDEAQRNAHDAALHDFVAGARVAQYSRYPGKGLFWLDAYSANMDRLVECEAQNAEGAQ